jgi:hypothetical protein
MTIRLAAAVCVVLAGGVARAQAPATVAGDWILGIERFGETRHQRMTIQSSGEDVTVESVAIGTLTGTLRNDRIELRRQGDPAPIMTGLLKSGEFSGDLNYPNLPGRWRAIRPVARPGNAPRVHSYEPAQYQSLYSPTVPPVLRIFPGDTVKTSTLDAAGIDAKGVRRHSGNNSLTGPFYVEGAVPGDTLIVKLTRVRLNRDTAFSGTTINNRVVPPTYIRTGAPAERADGTWLLDQQNSVARLVKPTPALREFTVPLRPMIGSIGVAGRESVQAVT